MKKFDTENEAELSRLRKKIDLIDVEILEKFSQRFSVVKRIGKLKRKIKIGVLQSSRWREVMDARLKQARRLGLSTELVRGVYKLIHDEAISIQKKSVSKKTRLK